VSSDDRMRAIRVVTASLKDLNDHVKLHDDWLACDDACRANGHGKGSCAMRGETAAVN
jgi:hypothetical protein